VIRLAQDRTRTLLTIHGWSAVLLGLLLYAVIVTGVASVFAVEINDWASPLARAPAQPFPPGVGRALNAFAETVDAPFRKDMFAVPLAGGRIKTFFHRDEKDARGRPLERGVAAEIDPTTLRVLSRHEGTDEEIDAGETSGALGDFMIEWHVRLHLPDPWGLLLTGLLGLAMMVAAVTGFLMHRHLIRELFTLRRFRDRVLAARDRHVLAGSWNLPFAFVLAFTGSYFSFASAFGIPAMAWIAFNGDEDRMFEAVVGVPPSEDARPAAVADLDAMIADARHRSRAEPFFLQAENWGRADALVTVFTEPAAGRLTSPTFVYRGANGDFLYEKPGFGLVPSLGSELTDLMGPLHFGDFAGSASKAVWFALGFAGAYVTLSGLTLWTERRRDRRGWRRLRRAVIAFGHGLPLALVAAACACFVTRLVDADVHAGMMGTFVAVLAAAFVATAALRDLLRVRQRFAIATGVALLGLPVLRLLCGGPSWTQAVAAGWSGIPALDGALILAGLACLIRGLRLRIGAATAASRRIATES
jgi:uncharacterized iron-regulated membrane protein